MSFILGFVLGAVITVFILHGYRRSCEKMYNQKLSDALRYVYQWASDNSLAMRSNPDLEHVAKQLDSVSLELFREIANLEIKDMGFDRSCGRRTKTV